MPHAFVRSPLLGGLLATEAVQRCTVVSSVFVRPGHSRHTSGPTKDGSSPVEEASGNSSFFISESTRALSGLSANDDRLLKQRGAHCSLAPCT